MNPQLRRFLIAGAAVTAGALAFFLGTIAWIGTESGSRFLLGFVERAANSQPGLHLHWTDARIAPFSRVSFTQLEASLNRDGNQIQFTLPRFELRYGISLLGRSLRIDELTIEKPAIQGKISVPKPSTEPTPASEPLDWTKLRELVANPPLRIELKEARIIDPTVNLTLHGDASTVPVDGSVRIAGTDGSLHFSWNPGKIEGRTEFSMKSGASRIEMKLASDLAPAHEDSVAFEPEAAFTSSFSIETPADHPGEWRVNVDGGKNFAGLRRFAFRRSFRDGRTAPWTVRFDEQRFAWQAGATPEKLHFDNTLSGSPILASLGAPMPPLRPGMNVETSATPDLSRFSTKGTFTLNGVSVLAGEVNGGLAQTNARADFQARIHSDSRLAPLAPALKSLPPIDAGTSGHLEIEMADEIQATLSKLEATFAGEKFLDGKMKLSAKDGSPSAEGQITVQVVHSFFDFARKRDRSFTLPADEASLLSMRVRTEFQATQKLRNEATTAHWSGKTLVSGIGPIQGARFEAPLEFTHEATQTQVGTGAPVLEAEFGGLIPKLNWKHELEATGTRFHSVVKMKGAATEFSWNADQDSVQARDPKSGKWLPLHGLRGEGEVTLDEAGRINARGIHFSFHDSLLSFEASATGDLKAGRAEASGTAALKVPAGFPEIAGVRLAGAAEFPWRLQLRQNRDIQFDGEVKFSRMGAGYGTYGFSGLTGRIPVSEALVTDGKSIRFAHLEIPNAFERVDFDRFQPFLQEAAQTQLGEIRYEDRKIGPLFGFFSLRQNLMSVHQFDFKLGSRGRAYGEFYLDANPEQLQMGVLSRVSEVDLAELLPSQMLKKAPEGNKNLSGRMGMVMNLTRSTVDGRMDITEIGGPQLVTMIRALDPKGKDEKLNRARMALGIAYPTFVGMNFSKGLMDMSVSMSAPVPGMTIRGIPIASMVATEFAPVRALLASSGSARAGSK